MSGTVSAKPKSDGTREYCKAFCKLISCIQATDHSPDLQPDNVMKKTGNRDSSININSRDVQHQKAKTYIHIELGAGNTPFICGDDILHSYVPSTNTSDIHCDACQCRHCDYSENEFRFKILSLTIKDVVEKHPDEKIVFYLNDIDVVALDQAVKFANKFIFNSYQKESFEFEVRSLPGDLFQLELGRLTPNAVHLKNPGVFFYKYVEGKSFTESIGHLVEQCAGCEAGGLIFSATNRAINQFKFRNLFTGHEKNPDGAILCPYNLPYEIRYRFPRPPRIDDLEEYSVFICKLH